MLLVEPGCLAEGSLASSEHVDRPAVPEAEFSFQNDDATKSGQAWHLSSALGKQLQERAHVTDTKRGFEENLQNVTQFLEEFDLLWFSCYTIWVNASLHYGSISLFQIWGDDTDQKDSSKSCVCPPLMLCTVLCVATFSVLGRAPSSSHELILSSHHSSEGHHHPCYKWRHWWIKVQYCFKIPALEDCLSRQAKLQTGVFPYLVSHYLPLGVWIIGKLIINYAFKELRSLLGLLFEGTKETQELPHHYNHWVFRSMSLLLYSWKDRVLKIYSVCVHVCT